MDDKDTDNWTNMYTRTRASLVTDQMAENAIYRNFVKMLHVRSVITRIIYFYLSTYVIFTRIFQTKLRDNALIMCWFIA